VAVRCDLAKEIAYENKHFQNNGKIRELSVDFATIEYNGNLIVSYSQIAGYYYIKQDAISVGTELTKIDDVFNFINLLGLEVTHIQSARYVSFMPQDSANLKHIRSSLLARPYVDNGFGVAAHLDWHPTGITFFVPLLNMHNRNYQQDWIETI